MEGLKMVIKRGMRDGRFNESNTVRYSNIPLENVVEMLDDIARRIEKGVYIMGTEVKAITVQRWTEVIKSADDVKEMADYYRQYMEG